MLVWSWFRTKEWLKRDDEIIVLEHVSGYLLVGIYHPFKCFDGETIRVNFLRLVSNLTRIKIAHANGMIV